MLKRSGAINVSVCIYITYADRVPLRHILPESGSSKKYVPQNDPRSLKNIQKAVELFSALLRKWFTNVVKY